MAGGIANLLGMIEQITYLLFVRGLDDSQTWLATSDDGAAKVSGGYWYPRQQREATAEVGDPGFRRCRWGSLQS